jgi:hypothetical protein
MNGTDVDSAIGGSIVGSLPKGGFLFPVTRDGNISANNIRINSSISTSTSQLYSNGYFSSSFQVGYRSYNDPNLIPKGNLSQYELSQGVIGKDNYNFAIQDIEGISWFFWDDSSFYCG